jgi:hypothetical protein
MVNWGMSKPVQVMVRSGHDRLQLALKHKK